VLTLVVNQPPSGQAVETPLSGKIFRVSREGSGPIYLTISECLSPRFETLDPSHHTEVHYDHSMFLGVLASRCGLNDLDTIRFFNHAIGQEMTVTDNHTFKLLISSARRAPHEPLIDVQLVHDPVVINPAPIALSIEGGKLGEKRSLQEQPQLPPSKVRRRNANSDQVASGSPIGPKLALLQTGSDLIDLTSSDDEVDTRAAPGSSSPRELPERPWRGSTSVDGDRDSTPGGFDFQDQHLDFSNEMAMMDEEQAAEEEMRGRA
jgi:hypothetical protein